MKKQIEINTIDADYTIYNAMEKFNTFGNKHALILFAIDKEEKVLGSISDGDLRRALTSGKDIHTPLLDIMNKDFQYIDSINDYVKLKSLKYNNFKIIPYLTKEKKIVDFIDLRSTKALLPLDAVIMAGGKGVRLQPYTHTCPKPMLELDGKPIIAHNIDRLIQFGVRNFYISVNYLKEQIIDFIQENYQGTDLNFSFIEENEPLGTIGSLSLIENFVNKDILVMNADILTNIDFEDLYLNYREHDDAMSVATFNVKVDIPYGVLETNGKHITSLLEKPNYVYYSNAGIYIIDKQFMNRIPKNSHYNATDFIEDLIRDNKKVSHFPIRGYWLDIGNLANYSKAQEDIKFIKF